MIKNFSTPSFIPRTSKLLYEAALKKNLKPVWFTDYGAFYCLVKGHKYYFNQSLNFFNSQLGSWFSKDKFATRQLLLLNDLAKYNIPYFFKSDLPALTKFFNQHHPLIAKPVLGERAKDVVLVEKQSQLKNFDLNITIFEKFIEGDEYRCLLLDNQLLALQKKVLSPLPNKPWKKKFINLQFDAQNQIQASLLDLALKINALIGQKLLAIDFILTPQQKIFLLELNSNPGLNKFHHPDEGEPCLVADKILEFFLAAKN